jgi:hypothetical protein
MQFVRVTIGMALIITAWYTSRIWGNYSVSSSGTIINATTSVGQGVMEISPNVFYFVGALLSFMKLIEWLSSKRRRKAPDIYRALSYLQE